MRSQAGTPTDRSEYGFEAYYSDKLTDSITIQPDFQYIKNPGTNTALDNAVALGLRLNVGL